MFGKSVLVALVVAGGASTSYAALINNVAFSPETEPNGSLATADYMSADTDGTPAANTVGISGSIASGDTSGDWSTFLLNTSGYGGSGNTVTLTFGTSENSRSLAAELFTSAGNSLGSFGGTINSSNPQYSRSYAVTTTGQYFVKLTSSSSSSATYELQAVGLNGAVVSVVPEPAALSLLGLVALPMLRRRRA
jgi:MYXO-CTERM domain-containing protein